MYTAASFQELTQLSLFTKPPTSWFLAVPWFCLGQFLKPPWAVIGAGSWNSPWESILPGECLAGGFMNSAVKGSNLIPLVLENMMPNWPLIHAFLIFIRFQNFWFHWISIYVIHFQCYSQNHQLLSYWSFPKTLPTGKPLDRYCSPIHGLTDFQELYQSNPERASNREAGGFVNSTVSCWPFPAQPQSLFPY